jgi:hypothetical protein
VIAGKKQGSDETPLVTSEWKKTCARCILPEVFMVLVQWQLHCGSTIKVVFSCEYFTFSYFPILKDMSRSQKDNIYAQASVTSEAWELFVQVMHGHVRAGKGQGTKALQEAISLVS